MDVPTIIRKLAELDPRFPDATALKKLIHAARRELEELPAQTHPAPKGVTATDFLAVLQIAVCITHDGKLDVIRRADTPEGWIVPLMAAHLHVTRLMGRELSKKAKLELDDYDKAVVQLADAMVDMDFEKAWAITQGDPA